ncbi:MAG: methyl-accepting chemotaxis protein [Acidobacteriota bacterium]
MLRNIKVTTRLILAFSLSLLLMAGLGVASFFALQGVSEAAEQILKNDVRIAALASQAQGSALQLRRFEKDYFLNIGDAEAQADYFSRWETQEKQLEATLAELRSLATNPDDAAAVESMTAGLASYFTGFEATVEQIEEGTLQTPQEANLFIGAYKDPIRSLISGSADFSQRRADQVTQQEQFVTGLIGSTRRDALIRTAVLLGLALLVAGLAGFGTARVIGRQLGSITNTFSRVAVGDFDARAKVYGGDELGKTAGAFNAMLDNIRGLMQSRDERDQMQGSIIKLLDQVSAVAEGDLRKETEVGADVTGAVADSFNFMILELRRIIREVQSATVFVSSRAGAVRDSTETLATGSTDQASRIRETSAVLGNVANDMQGVSERAGSAATVAEQALQKAKQGSDSVAKTIDGMNAIRNRVQETSKRIKRLGESSQEVGEIVQLIADLADRTGMLALNASIQAAAAGEAGRGFVVVAEEVERLAERASSSTRSIESLMRSMQSDTQEAVSAMEETTKEVVGGSSIAVAAGQALEEIERVTQELTQLIRDIATSTRRQAQSSESAAKTMADVSGDTLRNVEVSQRAAEELRELTVLADRLRESVDRFRLPEQAA